MNQSKLRKLRIEKYLTQDQVYVRSKRKMHQARISKLENGIFLLTEKDRKILAKVYGVSEAALT